MDENNKKRLFINQVLTFSFRTLIKLCKIKLDLNILFEFLPEIQVKFTSGEFTSHVMRGRFNSCTCCSLASLKSNLYFFNAK